MQPSADEDNDDVIESFWLYIFSVFPSFVNYYLVDRELQKSVIQDFVSKFETYRTTVNLNKKSSDRFSHSGRPRTRTQ